MTQAVSTWGAEETAARAGVRIRMLEETDELAAADRLLAQIWRTPDGLMGVNVLKALSHSGNYVAGAWSADELVGVSVAWAWGPGMPPALHSHITGVAPDRQGGGAGMALKTHQASWAAERGIDTITWTFDPLVRRNAWFNLVKLGARGESYHPDFYGPMSDGVNEGELTDRCLVVWRPASPPSPHPDVPDATAGTVILAAGPQARPEVSGEPASWPARLLCGVPADVVALRERSPELARDWRLALRETMGAAMAAGYAATSMTTDGYYVLERQDGLRARSSG